MNPKFNEIYLTFDDGPSPGITPGVLDLLLSANIKATFFCQGEKILQYPELIRRIKDEGHCLANHGFLHLNGMLSGNSSLLKNVQQGYYLTGSRLYRPPYGRLWPWQVSMLKEKGFHIIMWTIMSMDFSKKVSPSQCFQNVEKNLRPGAIIVFHDNAQAASNLLNTLPQLLNHFLLKDYKCVTFRNY